MRLSRIVTHLAEIDFAHLTRVDRLALVINLHEVLLSLGPDKRKRVMCLIARALEGRIVALEDFDLDQQRYLLEIDDITYCVLLAVLTLLDPLEVRAMQPKTKPAGNLN